MKAVLGGSLWRRMFAGPLRVKLTVERPDGTEVYHTYPLGDQTVYHGWRLLFPDGFEIGVAADATAEEGKITVDTTSESWHKIPPDVRAELMRRDQLLRGEL